MKHACIYDNKIVQIVDIIDDNEYAKLASIYNPVINIEDMIPQPKVGDILQGTVFVPHEQTLNPDALDLLQQENQRMFGSKLMVKLVDLVGARNLKLDRESQVVDVASLAAQMSSLKLLLETGAIKTVRGLCQATKAGFPHHEDIFDIAIADITDFLSQMGYE